MILNNLSPKISEWINSLDKVSLDTETLSLEDKTLLGFSFAGQKQQKVIGYYIPLGHSKIKNMPFKDGWKLLDQLCSVREIIFHNYSFDARVLSKYGLRVKHLPQDTLVLAQLWDENRFHRLKGLVEDYLGHRMLSYNDVCKVGKKKINFQDVDSTLADIYGTDDAVWTYKLFEYLYPKMMRDEDLAFLYHYIERPLLEVVRDMETSGISVDFSKVKKIEKVCKEKCESLEKKIKATIGDINVNSTKQLREYFIDKCHAPVIKTSRKTGDSSIDRETLERYVTMFPEAEWILMYRKCHKIYTSFVPALTPGDFGRIYASFNQSGTVSGRFSSSNPNMQNIPLEDEFHIREAILPDEGHLLVDADYSQIELRILAHFSRDPMLMKAYNEGLDVHQITADACGCSRQEGKTVNFGLMYRMSAKTLAKRLKISKEEAQTYVVGYFDTYEGISQFYKDVTDEFIQYGHIRTLYGRKRRLTKNFHKKDHIGKYHEMSSVINSKIQGTSADFIKYAMVLMFFPLKELGARILLTVHDEVVISAPKAKILLCCEIIEKAMLECGKLSVPVKITVKIGRTWGEAKHGLTVQEYKKNSLSLE